MTNDGEIDDADYIREVEAFRREKDEFFESDPRSPIPMEERLMGVRARYYPPALLFRVRAEVAPFAEPAVVDLATSTGDIRPQLRYAALDFRIGGHELHLTGFAEPDDKNPHELFIPFRDATSGHDTYGAGRYLEAEVEDAGDGRRAAVLDFNLAYNPYCAYSPSYSCPVPPAENALAVAITAGERTFFDDHD